MAVVKLLAKTPSKGKFRKPLCSPNNNHIFPVFFKKYRDTRARVDLKQKPRSRSPSTRCFLLGHAAH